MLMGCVDGRQVFDEGIETGIDGIERDLLGFQDQPGTQRPHSLS